MPAQRRENLIFEASRWYLVLGLLQLAVWPMVYRTFTGLADRGYSVSRWAGLLVVSWCCWAGWVLGLWSAASGSAWTCLALVTAACWLPGLRRPDASPSREALGWLLRHRRQVLSCELVVLAGFLLACLVRSGLPGVFHTEQPSDMMVLASLWASPRFPAEDAWLAGYPLSYYHFGYWMQTVLGHLAEVPPRWGYNLGLATVFAAMGVAAFGIGCNLAAACPRLAGEKWAAKSRVKLGVLAALAVCVAGSVGSLYDLAVHAWTKSDWWWFSSRGIRDLRPDGLALPAITEFPAFSLVLGDNHPHLHGAPLLLMMAAFVCHRVICARHREPGREPIRGVERGGVGLLLAAILMTNSWDLAPALILLAAGLIFAVPRGMPAPGTSWQFAIGGWRAAREMFLIVGLALLLALPHFSYADASVRGVLPNLLFPTRLDEAVAVSGVAWAGLVLVGLISLRELSRASVVRCLAVGLGGFILFLAAGAGWLVSSVEGLGWLARQGFPASPEVWGEILRRRIAAPFVPVLLILAGSMCLLMLGSGQVNRHPGRRAVLLLAGVAVMLLLIPELAFVHDSFEYRVNTVFKFHFGAWLLLGIAGAGGLSLWRYPGSWGRIRIGVLAFFLLSLLYPLAATVSRVASEPPPWPTLDTRAPLEVQNPDFYCLLDWMDRELPVGASVLQAPGNPAEAQSALVSSLTGHPTPLGWADHQRQWRSGAAMQTLIEDRGERIRRVYEAKGLDQLRMGLAVLGLELVYVGTRESGLYRIPDLESVFDVNCEVLFRSGRERLYRCAEVPGGVGN